MKLCIVLEAQADDSVDPSEVLRQFDELLGNEQVAAALGLKATVQEVYDAELGSRTRDLQDVADALQRVGFDELPEAIQPEGSDDGEPLEVRLSLSVSASNFPSVSVDDLLEALLCFGDGELEAMGPMGVISLFDAFGREEVSARDAYLIARDTAERIAAAAEVSERNAEHADEPDEPDEPDAESAGPEDHEAVLDEAQHTLQQQLDEKAANEKPN